MQARPLLLSTVCSTMATIALCLQAMLMLRTENERDGQVPSCSPTGLLLPMYRLGS